MDCRQVSATRRERFLCIPASHRLRFLCCFLAGRRTLGEVVERHEATVKTLGFTHFISAAALHTEKVVQTCLCRYRRLTFDSLVTVFVQVRFRVIRRCGG